jgi:transposase
LGIRQVARSLGLAHSTVSELLQRAAAAGLTWPLPEGMDEAALEAKLYPGNPEGQPDRPTPDWGKIHLELRRKGVTLQLLWFEYRQTCPDGYQYSRFCELYRFWRKKVDVVMRQQHRAGEKMFVDWAGATAKIVERESGEIREAPVFVAVLGASSYAYVEVYVDQTLPCWVSAHTRAVEQFGGVPEVVVPDQPRTGVKEPCHYEPELNPTYQEWAEHYGTVVIPARPAKPRDKAKVESGVLQVERWVLAPLRNRTFFSVQEANEAIHEATAVLNDRPFQALAGSRRQLYETLDRPALRPLPPGRFVYAQWRTARVNIDYHVEVEKSYYSVPYQLAGEQVDVRLTATTVEALHKGRRVASHARSYKEHSYITLPEHMPAAHRKHAEWSPGRLVSWSTTSVGPQAGELVQQILKTRRHPEQGYRSCLGLMRLARRYGPERLEAACQRAMNLKAYAYRHVQSILEKGLDRQPLVESAEVTASAHANVRGANYYAAQKGVV